MWPLRFQFTYNFSCIVQARIVTHFTSSAAGVHRTFDPYAAGDHTLYEVKPLSDSCHHPDTAQVLLVFYFTEPFWWLPTIGPNSGSVTLYNDPTLWR